MGALLEALRADLRRELLLEPTGPRKVWLTNSTDAQWAQHSAEVRASLREAQRTMAPTRQSSPVMDTQEPEPRALGAVNAAYAKVEQTLRDAIESLRALPSSGLGDVVQVKRRPTMAVSTRATPTVLKVSA